MILSEIREKRIRAGLSPERLGAQLKLDGKTVRNIEGGNRPSLTTALIFADWLDKDVLDVFPELAEERQPKNRAAA